MQLLKWNRAAFAIFAIAALFVGLARPGTAQTAPPAEAPLNPKLPTIFVVGDSTARNTTNGALGWGAPFISYFDASKANVVNRAMAGRSSRSYIFEKRWEKVLAEMKAGDFVLLQMGHNDGGNIEDAKARASLPGLGDESREITRPDGTPEVVHTYGHNMRQFITDTKAKGATPIMLSLTPRNIWKNGQVEHGSGNYAQLISQLAKEQGLEYLDLTSIVVNQYQAMGEEKVKAMFGPDDVHTSPAGAEVNAASVVSGLKQLPHVHLDAFLSEKGRAVPILLADAPAAAPDVAAPAANVPTTTIPAAAPATPATTTAATTTAAPGTAPAPFKLRPLPVPANPKLPTLFLIGDSTVRNGNGDGGGGQWGWGEPIVTFFDTTKINVVNRAVGGLSSRTYVTSGYWDATKAMIKPGDFVIMQFGHNDSGAINDTSRARATLRGTGEESEEIDNLLTKKHEVVHTYGWYLRQFVAETKALGATPMICSPIPRKSFSPDGKANRSKGTYAGWAGDVAKAQGIAFIDLNEIIARQYDVLGPAKVEPLFADPNTHTSMAGAEINAASVVSGLKGMPNNPLAPYFSTKATNVAKADLTMPALAPAVATP